MFPITGDSSFSLASDPEVYEKQSRDLVISIVLRPLEVAPPMGGQT